MTLAYLTLAYLTLAMVSCGSAVVTQPGGAQKLFPPGVHLLLCQNIRRQSLILQNNCCTLQTVCVCLW